MRRVLKYDGLIPVIKKADGTHSEVTPDTIREMRRYVSENRTVGGNKRNEFDIVKDGVTPKNNRKARAVVEPFAAAGATWWMESMWGYKNLRAVRERVKAGPPG